MNETDDQEQGTNSGVEDAPSEASAGAEAVEDAPSSGSGVDLSSIRFRGGSAEERPRSTTSHSSLGGTREVLAVDDVSDSGAEVAGGSARGSAQPVDGPTGEDGTGAEADAILATLRESQQGATEGSQKRRISAPRAGASEGNWSLDDESPAPEAVLEAEDSVSVRLEPGGPPVGPWEEISEEDWGRLTTNDKERIDGLATEMQRMEASDTCFEWFDVTYESPPGAIKKAYFKLARRYHPDALADEPESYSRVATSLFAKISEAYDILSDDEEREKYINRHIHGIKDEDELAMEKVQQVLAAEAAFKAGMTVLNNGKITEALQHFKKAVDGYPDEAEYVAYYGYTLFRATQNSDLERSQEGIALIEKSIQLKEMSPKPYHLLGKVYLVAGDGAEAKKWLRKSLKLQPDNPEAVRDYRRAEGMLKSGGGAAKGGGDEESKSKGGLAGFFSRFKKEKKKAPVATKEATSLDDFDFSQFKE